MMTTTPRLLGFASLALTTLLTACTGHVVDAGSSGGPDTTPPLTHETNAITAIAIPFSALFPGGGLGSGIDPNTVYLEFGDATPTCSAPNPTTTCGNHFSVSIGIPPAMLSAGNVIQLSDQQVISTFDESGAATGADPNDCPGGGGSFLSGQISIDAVDSASVHFTLSGAQPLDFGPSSVNASYVAARCF
jgi:hypothetical protein